jgi:putative transposase
LLPSLEQAAVLAEHCRHARFVWNLAVEQQQHWQPGRRAPGYNEQCAQLTAARAEYDWLEAGSQTVQQQALRDFAQAMRNFFHGTHHRPTWRKAGKHEGFRQVGLKPRHIKRLNRRFGQVWIPKLGWVKFRWTRAIADTVKSYRVTCQAVFQCVACDAGPCNADVNAARNIAAGRAVTARRDLGASRSVNREPQLCSPAA